MKLRTMTVRSSFLTALGFAIVVAFACSSGSNPVVDANAMGLPGGTSSTTGTGGAVDGGGLGRGGRFGGGGNGTGGFGHGTGGAGGSSCAPQNQSCETLLCCSGLLCCSNSATRSCQPNCGTAGTSGL
jgi:hypothetical protein